MQSFEPGPRRLEETKRIARVLEIISRIHGRPKVWTRRALAQAYEVSERQIQNDLQIISYRLHLELCRTRQGYYFVDPKPLPAISLNFGEAVALLMAAGVGRSTGGIDSAELAAALARISTGFPPELRGLLDALASDPMATPRPHRRHVLEMLHEAVATRTTVDLRYATASRDGEESVRQVDPYCIVPYVRSFHLIGHCHLRGEVRIFKADRVRAIRLTAARFQLPPDFDVASYLGDSWGLLRGVGGEPQVVEILFSPTAGRWVSEETWHPSQQTEWREDGCLLFRLRVSVGPALVGWVLRYGPHARVQRPEALADQVRQRAAETAALYSASAERSTVY